MRLPFTVLIGKGFGIAAQMPKRRIGGRLMMMMMMMMMMMVVVMIVVMLNMLVNYQKSS